MSSLSIKLKNRRKEKGYSLDKLGSLVGASKSYLWELENKSSLTPSAKKLSAIADALDVSIYFFIDDSACEPKEMHLDESFYRNYKKLDSRSKDHMRKILKTFSSQQT